MVDESWVKENKKDEKKKDTLSVEYWNIWFYGADVDFIEIVDWAWQVSIRKWVVRIWEYTHIIWSMTTTLEKEMKREM